MAAEMVMVFAHATGRILVMPPEAHWYLLGTSKEHEQNHHTFHSFFDLSRVRTFLSRADVARMRHIWLSSPDQGGDM